MIFGPVQRLNYKEPYKIIIDNQMIHECKSTKFLGVVIDKKLSFSPHINSISKKISKTIGIMNKCSYN